MDITLYQQNAIRTAKMFESHPENLLHVIMGMGSECGELSLTVNNIWCQLPHEASNISEEIGDACWYIALACEVLGWKFEDLMLAPDNELVPDELATAVFARNPVSLVLLATHFAGECIGVVKAYVVYQKDFDSVTFKKYLSLTMTTLSLIADLHGFEFCKVLDGNIGKLRKRYPNKYSDADAVARADKVEALPAPTSVQ